MDTKHLKKELSSGKDVLIVDVREHDEYEKGEKMAEAKNIPMGQMFVEAAQGHLPKDKKIITVCKSGTRCQIVAKELKEKGYDIEYLEGGMDAWKKEE